jgi:NAD-dependent dihydropyrimidine dehydrogenase PreA subunit
MADGLRYLEDVVTLRYDPEKCTGCQLCTMVCPHGVFAMEGNRAKLVDGGACMECGACQRNCAFDAIHVDSGVGCASAIIASWFNGGTVTCGSDAGSSCESESESGTSKGTCC